MNWAVGDSVGMVSVTPFVLVHVMPWFVKHTNAYDIAAGKRFPSKSLARQFPKELKPC